jgi:pimeloyl-ACP methyl ester carboxylesterase
MNKELFLNGSKIFYRVFGKGKPVMLIHGFGETGEIWNNQIDYLKNDFHLIVPDLPGSGLSDRTHDMSMEGMADIVKFIFDTESAMASQAIEKVTMIGHSMGGYITLAFAEKYPIHLQAFGLFHSTAYADSEEKKAARKKGIEFVKQYGAFEFLKTSVPNLFSPDWKQQKPGALDEFIRSLHNFSAASLVSYYEAMLNRPDRSNLLKTTNLPVLFVIGDYDNAIPVQDTLKQSLLPEKSYIHILHRSGHMGMLEEESKSNDLLKKFISET